MSPSRDQLCRTSLSLLTMLLFMTAIYGCKSSEHAGRDDSASGTATRSGTISSAKSSSDGSLNDTKVQAQIESQFVVGPAAARDLDYFVKWQYNRVGDPIKRMDVQGDSVFTLDKSNVLTRIQITDGSRLWHVAATNDIEEIQGINFVGDKIYLTNGGLMLVYDSSTGAQTGTQKLEKIANTQPVHFDRYLIYGSRNGQVVWHVFSIGFPWSAYQVAHSIENPPVVSGNFLVATGTDGSVMVLSPSAATQYWGKRLLSPVTAEPAAGNGALYVAGLDQYVHAYDLGSGRTLWKTLFDSPLKESPVIAGDRVYQQVPGQGIVAFEALPNDSPGGKIVWKAKDIKGSVILKRRDNLFVWDPSGRQLTVLDVGHGSVVRTVNLPRVKFLKVPGGADSKDGDIYAAGDDCRVVRLVPRN